MLIHMQTMTFCSPIMSLHEEALQTVVSVGLTVSALGMPKHAETILTPS